KPSSRRARPSPPGLDCAKRGAAMKDARRLLRISIAAGAVLAGAASGSPQDFVVGTASAARGTVAYGELKVPAGSDAATSIAVVVVNGAKPGPVVAFVAGSHGTEYASIVALTRLA